MTGRLRGVLPLSLSTSLLAFAWVELSLNFSFHWVTAGDLGVGLGLPTNLQLIAPTAFISWAMFFAAGADGAAFTKTVVSSTIGTVAGLVCMLVSPKVADLPDFWGIALVLSILVFVAVALTTAGDWYYVPGVFVAFASVVLWWFATGLDGWAENGGGVGNSIKALGDPTTAGTGAFGGVFSTPAEWVFVSSLVTLLCGAVLGFISVKLAGILAPLGGKSAAAE